MTSPSQLILDFLSYLKESDAAVAVAVIKSLTNVIARSEAKTMMEMESELRDAATELKRKDWTQMCHGIAITASCQLFLRYVTRCFLEFHDFEHCKSQLINRGKLFAETSSSSRKQIAEFGHRFIKDGTRVMTHGDSRVVTSLLSQAAKKVHFSVIVTEGRSQNLGMKAVKKLQNANIPTKLILDASMGYYMERVDMVIVGAEGVVENGGIVNTVGTYAMAMIAQTMKIPVYVAAESYKFARLYPLYQKDVPQTFLQVEGTEMENPLYDYTPPAFISLIFTDLGVLTPSAVSDELIKLYQ